MGEPESNDAEQKWLGAAVILTIFAGLVIHAAGGWPWIATWLQSANAPAWVQAVGAVLAILASTWIVGRQMRDARRLAAQAVLRERQYHFLIAWESFLRLAQRAATACGAISIQLNSRTDVHTIATAGEFDYTSLDVIARWLDRIDPLQTPATLVDNGIELAAAVKRFRRLVEHCLADHRAMNAAQFDTWFKDTRREVGAALQVVQHVFSDLEHLKSLHAKNLDALLADAAGK